MVVALREFTLAIVVACCTASVSLSLSLRGSQYDDLNLLLFDLQHYKIGPLERCRRCGRPFCMPSGLD